MKRKLAMKRKRFWYLRHLLEFRWGVCASCKRFRTNIVWYFPTTCGYCDFMDGQ